MRLDHLVVGCTDLVQGEAWLAERLGFAASGGGEHLQYGTHNRLWRLDGHRYLELIACKPGPSAAQTPPFGLSQSAVQARLAERPRLLTWVARVDPRDSRERVWAACPGLSDPVAVQRGDFHWHLAIARDSGLCDGGAIPHLIWWQPPHPTDVLPPLGLALETLSLRAPDRDRLASLAAQLPGEPVTVVDGQPGLVALIRTELGRVELD